TAVNLNDPTVFTDRVAVPVASRVEVPTRVPPTRTPPVMVPPLKKLTVPEGLEESGVGPLTVAVSVASGPVDEVATDRAVVVCGGWNSTGRWSGVPPMMRGKPR